MRRQTAQRHLSSTAVVASLMRPTEMIEACLASHRRLEAAVGSLSEQEMRVPSLLPGWSRAHVLTHLAQKTATHVWLICGAEADEVREQYPSGHSHTQIGIDVAAGSVRPASVLRADLARSFDELEAAWARLGDEHWSRTGICVPGARSMSQIVDRHLRDVEVHHVDLDIGYSPSDWPESFVMTELAKRLADLPGRARHHDLLAWLLGRSDAPDLEPW